jgi:hypothetical protein
LLPNLFGRKGATKAMNKSSQWISNHLGEFQATDLNQFLKTTPEHATAKSYEGLSPVFDFHVDFPL